MQNRREFIKRAAVALAVLVVVSELPVENDAYTLYADGVHDDADALQAWLDGEDVYYANGEKVGSHLKGKTFLIRSSIDITSHPHNEGYAITHCYFQNAGWRGGSSL